MISKSPSLKGLFPIKSPKLQRPQHQKSVEINMVEQLRPSFNREKEMPVSKDQFLQKYEDIKNERYFPLHLEFQKLTETSMAINENQQSFFKTMHSISDLHLDGMSYIMQMSNVRITISKSSFTNDRIDAVFIPFLHVPNSIRYIVSSDPSLDSMTDFLQMIWEHKIKYIITLTKIGKEKYQSPAFWPIGKGKVYFDEENPTFEISKKNEMVFGNLIKRTLSMKQSGFHQREVIQFHLTTNSGRNYSPYLLYNELLTKIQEITHGTPILFHSSISNLDQCAVLISINEIISKLLEKDEINIFETVLQMNQHKNLMIQEEHQFVDIYEYLSCYLRDLPDLDMTLVPEKSEI